MPHPAQHIDQAVMKTKRVLFTGTASTTYRQGVAVAYDRDYGTAATLEESRDKRVEPISQTNNLRFAGVLADDVTLDSTGIEWVTIYEPGGCAYLALGSDSVVNSTLLWFTAGTGGNGRWRADKGVGTGRGCALALQTNASGVLGESIDGTAVVNGTAVVDTGLFTGAAAGDYLVIMASATAAGAAGATAGVYTISSVTDTANAVLTTSASSAASEFAGYVVSGNPTCLAYLYDGTETGGIEWIECLNNAASQSMVGGATHILAGVTLGTADATCTLADGTYIGERKLFKMAGALTTSDYALTVTTSPEVAVVRMDADADEILFEWVGVDGWKVVSSNGATTLAMAPAAGILAQAESYQCMVSRSGSLVTTQFVIDLTGLECGGTANDIIGPDAAVSHLGQITAAMNGTIVGGMLMCQEAPTGGDPDIDVYSATEATGAEDADVTALTETALCNSGDLALNSIISLAPPAADQYLYLACGTATQASYTAGKITLTFWGYA